MHLVLIRFKQYDGTVRDIAAVRNKPAADKLIKELQEKYPSYQTGEFEHSRIKYIKQ